MAISGQFLADFIQFEGATKNATATLEKFEGTGAKVDSRLKSLSGTSMRGAVGTQHWTGQLRQFDGVLGSLGAGISKPVRALTELGAASGQTVASFGLLGAAGLVLGAVIGGWKTGRAIAGWLDLDATIGNATARLMGFDPAAAAAGARLDTIHKAIADGMPDWMGYTAAIAWNTVTADKAAKVLQDLDDVLTRQKGPGESLGQIQAWQAELQKLTDAGVLDQFTVDLESNNFSQKELAERYVISTEAVALFGRQLTTAATELAATDKVFADIAKEYDRANAVIAKSASDAATALAEANGRIAFDILSLGEQLATIDPVLAAHATALLAAGVAAADVALSTGLAAREVRVLEEAMGRGTGTAAGYADALSAVDRANAKLAADAATPTPNPGKYGTPIQYGAFNPGGGGALGSHARPDESFVVSSGGGGGGGSTVTAPRPSGGTLVMNNYINGTGADVARQIEAHWIQKRKTLGLI